MPPLTSSFVSPMLSAGTRWVRPAILGVIAVVLTVEIVLVWDQLANAWGSLFGADRRWLCGAVVAALASMHSFARIQRTLLHSAGVPVTQWRSEAAFYAANSLSSTLPGGPVLSTTFLYRQQRHWGASPVVASWQLVISGMLQAAGLSLLGLGGAFLLGARNNPVSWLLTLGGFLTLLMLAQTVAARPELLDGIGVRVLSTANSLRDKPADTGLDAWRRMIDQLKVVSLGRRNLSAAFGWSLFNWIADVACLACAAYAAGGHVSAAGLTVTYAAARAAGTIPLIPGGLLIIEAVLVPGLVSSGMALPDAISAVLVYRLVSWLLIAAVGWVVFVVMFRDDHGAAAVDVSELPPAGSHPAAAIPPPAGPRADLHRLASRRPHRLVTARSAAARAPAAS